MILLGIAVLLLTGLLLAREAAWGSQFIFDEKGNLAAVKRDALGDSASLAVHAKIEREGEKAEEDMILTLRGEKRDTESVSGKAEEMTPEQQLQEKLREAADEVENSEEAVVMLPVELEDGSRIRWSRQKDYSFVLCLLFFPLGLSFLHQGQKQRVKRKNEERTAAIRKALPGFNNQLLLLLNSGLIFNDAFLRIAEGHAVREKKDPFSEILADMLRRSQETGSSLIAAMESYAKTLGIREFSRLTAILADNQYKGVDLTDKLAAESDMLWEQRKKTAEEKGKAAETKLSFPLAVLLLVLILVAAAPAMLQM